VGQQMEAGPIRPDEREVPAPINSPARFEDDPASGRGSAAAGESENGKCDGHGRDDAEHA